MFRSIKEKNTCASEEMKQAYKPLLTSYIHIKLQKWYNQKDLIRTSLFHDFVYQL